MEDISKTVQDGSYQHQSHDIQEAIDLASRRMMVLIHELDEDFAISQRPGLVEVRSELDNARKLIEQAWQRHATASRLLAKAP